MKHTKTYFGFDALEDEPLPSIDSLRNGNTVNNQEVDYAITINFLRINALLKSMFARKLREDILHSKPHIQLHPHQSILSLTEEERKQHNLPDKVTIATHQDIAELKTRSDYIDHHKHSIYSRLSHIQQQAREEIDENMVDMFTHIHDFIQKSRSDTKAAQVTLSDAIMIAGRSATICIHQGMKPKEAQQFMADILREMFSGALEMHMRFNTNHNEIDEKNAIEALFKFFAIEPKLETIRH